MRSDDEQVNRIQELEAKVEQWEKVALSSDPVKAALGLLEPSDDEPCQHRFIHLASKRCARCGSVISLVTNQAERWLRAEAAEQTMAALGVWADTYGAALAPHGGAADTYGDGIRAAKAQVKAHLAGQPAAPSNAFDESQSPGGRCVQCWRDECECNDTPPSSAEKVLENTNADE